MHMYLLNTYGVPVIICDVLYTIIGSAKMSASRLSTV
jgi:hypothetical protein